MSNSQPLLYVKTGCPYCKAAMDLLDEKKIAYQQIDVRAEPDRMADLEAVSSQTRTPTLVAGEAVLADFGVEQAEPFLREQGLLK